MKYTLVIAALLGLASFEQVEAIRITQMADPVAPTKEGDLAAAKTPAAPAKDAKAPAAPAEEAKAAPAKDAKAAPAEEAKDAKAPAKDAKAAPAKAAGPPKAAPVKDDSPKADQKGSKITIADGKKKPAVAAEEEPVAPAKDVAPAEKKAAAAKPDAKPEGKPVIKNKYDELNIHHEEPFNGISSATVKVGHQDTQTTNPAKKEDYVPTSIYPTKINPTGFVQEEPVPAKAEAAKPAAADSKPAAAADAAKPAADAAAKPAVADPAPKKPKAEDDGPKADQPGSKAPSPKPPANAAEEVPEKDTKPADKAPKCPEGKTCNLYDPKKIHHEEPFNGISSADIKFGHQDTQTTNPAAGKKYVPTSIYPTSHDPTGFAEGKVVSLAQIEDDMDDFSS